MIELVQSRVPLIYPQIDDTKHFFEELVVTDFAADVICHS